MGFGAREGGGSRFCHRFVLLFLFARCWCRAGSIDLGLFVEFRVAHPSRLASRGLASGFTFGSRLVGFWPRFRLGVCRFAIGIWLQDGLLVPACGSPFRYLKKLSQQHLEGCPLRQDSRGLYRDPSLVLLFTCCFRIWTRLVATSGSHTPIKPDAYHTIRDCTPTQASLESAALSSTSFVSRITFRLQDHHHHHYISPSPQSNGNSITRLSSPRRTR